MHSLEQEIAALIIEVTGLEDTRPEEIEPDAPLFGDGLGLDSIDALEIGLALHRRYGLVLSADSGGIRQHFTTLRALARFVAAERGGEG